MTETQKQEITARINTLVPQTTDEAALVSQLIDDAEAFVLSYCARTVLPDALQGAVGDLAVIAYNRRGTEGESARTEGGATLNFETAPASVYNILNRYRLARAGGTTHEATTG